jgi:NCAIR mutase (PurE)-related protein
MAKHKALVGIIMGSDSDLPVMEAAARVLEDFGVSYELTIVSAHRTPDVLVSFSRCWRRSVDRILCCHIADEHIRNRCTCSHAHFATGFFYTHCFQQLFHIW